MTTKPTFGLSNANISATIWVSHQPIVTILSCSNGKALINSLISHWISSLLYIINNFIIVKYRQQLHNYYIPSTISWLLYRIIHDYIIICISHWISWLLSMINCIICSIIHCLIHHKSTSKCTWVIVNNEWMWYGICRFWRDIISELLLFDWNSNEFVWRKLHIMSNLTWASISKRMLNDCLNYILKDRVQVTSKRVLSLCYCFYQNKFHRFVSDFHNPFKRLCWFLYHIKMS